MDLNEYYENQEKLAIESLTNELDMLENEEVFIEDKLKNTIIYKYMNLEHFLYIVLNKNIYLPCVKKWADKYEISEAKLPVGIPHDDDDDDDNNNIKNLDFFNIFHIEGNGRLKIREPYYLKYDILQHFYGSCFSLNKDSDSLWRIYSKNNDGIVVGLDSNFCTNEKSAALFSVVYYDGKITDGIKEREVLFKDKVKYRFIRIGFLKRGYFRHENEVRFLKLSKVVTDHLIINIDIQKIVKSVIVNPFSSEEFYNIVNNICMKELSIKAEKSSLYSNDLYDKTNATIIYRGSKT